MSIISPSEIDKAVDSLAQGDVVAMPTETVYGLAARIDKTEALEKIFRVKQRPFFDPLIVHVADKSQAPQLTKSWPPIAEYLAEKFWPGPLTLVLPKSEKVHSLISSGLETVGIRCPKHPVALELIKKAQIPLAAPSANRFGRTSPTSALHVEMEFPNENFWILDGGLCDIGIESTVLKIESNGSVTDLFILRKGLVTQHMLEQALGSGNFKFEFKETTNKQASPGHTEHHYMPAVPLVYCASPESSPTDLMQKLKSKGELKNGGDNPGILKLPREGALAARALYAEMRRLAESGHDSIIFYAEDWQKSEAWQAVLDRIYRAATIRLLN